MSYIICSVTRITSHNVRDHNQFNLQHHGQKYSVGETCVYMKNIIPKYMSAQWSLEDKYITVSKEEIDTV